MEQAIDPFVDILWRLSSGLSIVGLVAALLGLALISFGLVNHFKSHSGEMDRPRAAWGTPPVRAGMVLFLGGIALSIAVFGVRLLGSD